MAVAKQIFGRLDGGPTTNIEVPFFCTVSVYQGLLGTLKDSERLAIREGKGFPAQVQYHESLKRGMQLHSLFGRSTCIVRPTCQGNVTASC